MIRRLRRKFLLAAVAAVFLVLLVLMGCINALNYSSLVREADATLDILVRNGGSFRMRNCCPASRKIWIF